jgi:hypothetical protein
VDIHCKNEHELKTIGAGNQTFKQSEMPFALNQTHRAGNFTLREKIIFAANFILPGTFCEAD